VEHIHFIGGVLSGSLNIVFTHPEIIKSKYSLPPSLRMLTHVVCAYDAAFQVIYVAIINGLIGLTWPVSIPLIRYLYKKPIEDKDN